MKKKTKVALKAYAKALLGDSNTARQDAWEEWQSWLDVNDPHYKRIYDEYQEDREWLEIIDSDEGRQFIEPYFRTRRLRLSIQGMASTLQQVWGDYDRLTKELEKNL